MSYTEADTLSLQLRCRQAFARSSAAFAEAAISPLLRSSEGCLADATPGALQARGEIRSLTRRVSQLEAAVHMIVQPEDGGMPCDYFASPWQTAAQGRCRMYAAVEPRSGESLREALEPIEALLRQQSAALAALGVALGIGVAGTRGSHGTDRPAALGRASGSEGGDVGASEALVAPNAQGGSPDASPPSQLPLPSNVVLAPLITESQLPPAYPRQEVPSDRSSGDLEKKRRPPEEVERNVSELRRASEPRGSSALSSRGSSRNTGVLRTTSTTFPTSLPSLYSSWTYATSSLNSGRVRETLEGERVASSNSSSRWLSAVHRLNIPDDIGTHSHRTVTVRKVRGDAAGPGECLQAATREDSSTPLLLRIQKILRGSPLKNESAQLRCLTAGGAGGVDAALYVGGEVQATDCHNASGASTEGTCEAACGSGKGAESEFPTPVKRHDTVARDFSSADTSQLQLLAPEDWSTTFFSDASAIMDDVGA